MWHAVLNLEDAVAITESYVARRDFDAVLARYKRISAVNHLS